MQHFPVFLFSLTGHAITEDIMQEKAEWIKLFEKPDFFENYQYVFIAVKTKPGLLCTKTLKVTIKKRNELCTCAIFINVYPFILFSCHFNCLLFGLAKYGEVYIYVVSPAMYTFK